MGRDSNRRVTGIGDKSDSTNGTRTTSVRFSPAEKALLLQLVAKVQKKLPRKKINSSKVLRGVSYIHDSDFIDQIVESIKQNL